MRAARGTPQLEARQTAEHEQRLADGAGSSLHEHALALFHPGRAVEELIRGRPAQDQRGRLRRVDARRHAGQAVSPERAIGRVGADDRHIGHAVPELKTADAIAELIDFADDVVPHHKGRPVAHRLRVEVTPDQHIGVL